MNTTTSLAWRYAAAHPEAAAERLSVIAPDASASFLAEVTPEVAASLLVEMWPAAAAAAVELIPDERAGEILVALSFNRLVALLRLLPDETRERLESTLPQNLAHRCRHALSLPAGTAGSVADSSVSPFEVDTTVGEARTRGCDPRVPYLYVVDREHRLVGVIHRRDLDAADDEAPLGSIMTARVQSIPASAPLALVHDHVAWSDLDALPVVDARGALVGVIRHKLLRATRYRSRVDAGPTTAVSALLDLGEAYWSSLFSAILTFSSSRSGAVTGGPE